MSLAALPFMIILSSALLLAFDVGLLMLHSIPLMYTHLPIHSSSTLVGSLSVLLGSQLIHLGDTLLELVVLALLVGVSLLLCVC